MSNSTHPYLDCFIDRHIAHSFLQVLLRYSQRELALKYSKSFDLDSGSDSSGEGRGNVKIFTWGGGGGVKIFTFVPWKMARAKQKQSWFIFDTS